MSGPTAVLADPTVPLSTHTAVTEWEFAPVVTAIVAALALAYLVGMWRVRRAHPARPWPLLRALSFFAGLGVIVVATQSSVGAYDDVLFSIHMVQHLLLIMVAPPLLVLGRPVMLALHATHNPAHRWILRVVRSRVVTVLTCPPVAAAVYAVTIVGTHLTGFMNVTLHHENVHNAEHVLYLLAGYLYFLPLLGSEPIRWRMSYPGRFLLLALTMPVDTFVGVVLIQANHELFPAYADAHRTWGPGLVADLHDGGAIMWIGGDAIMFALMVCLFIALLRDRSAQESMGSWLESARRQALLDRTAEAGDRSDGSRSHPAATVDDDEHLAAYNSYLASLNRPRLITADDDGDPA